jgi:hypothetical protein
MCFSYDQGAAVVDGPALQRRDLHKLDDAEKITKEIKEQEGLDQEVVTTGHKRFVFSLIVDYGNVLLSYRFVGVLEKIWLWSIGHCS